MRFIKIIITICVFFCATQSLADPFSQRTDVSAFIQQIAKQNEIDTDKLITMLDQVQLQNSILESISAPKEAKPWYVYRNNFLTTSRVQQGVEFWQQHADTLKRAEETYGVPANMIVAILGVETFYGQHKGTYRVLDALATLAFEYPPRAPFFKKELEAFLMLIPESPFDPYTLRGSYAGAFGQSQFMPSSYQKYAVDFSGLHKKDIENNSDDAIGSIANYFKEHGWQTNQPVAAPVRLSGTHYKTLTRQSSISHKTAMSQLKPNLTVAEYKKMGVAPRRQIAAHTRAAMITLETEDKPEYWLTFNNFYTIMRYNPSPNYAMAVYQLSQALQMEYNKQTADNSPKLVNH